MTPILKNPSHARWARRIVFLLAAIGALLLARGDNLDGTHDYLGAVIIAAVIIGIGCVIEAWDRRRPDDTAPDGERAYWKCPVCSHMNPAFLGSCGRCGAARQT